MQIADIQEFMERFAPMPLAEEWDNVGLLIGRPVDPVESVMTCLTLTPDVATEAIAAQADCIVTHHPVLFRSVQQITSLSSEGEMLLALIQAHVAVYSPHTSFDSAPQGINQELAEMLGLQAPQPLRPTESDPSLGSGRFGDLAAASSLQEVAELTKTKLQATTVQVIGEAARPVTRMGVACGAAAEFMVEASQHGCDVLLTGEARFHDCLRANALGIALIVAGHYATERPAVESLARVLAAEFPQLRIWASQVETDPITWM